MIPSFNNQEIERSTPQQPNPQQNHLENKEERQPTLTPVKNLKTPEQALPVAILGSRRRDLNQCFQHINTNRKRKR
ncbi:hypothetical protein YC2023_095168 [Brassica napus]